MIVCYSAFNELFYSIMQNRKSSNLDEFLKIKLVFFSKKSLVLFCGRSNFFFAKTNFKKWVLLIFYLILIATCLNLSTYSRRAAKETRTR